MHFSVSSVLGLATLSLLIGLNSAESFPSRDYKGSQRVFQYQSEADVIAEIGQVLAAYGFYLDQKNYDAFPSIFTNDIETNIFGDPPTKNVGELIAGFKDSRPFTSLHSSSNEFVYDISGHYAKVSSYNTAYFFGEGHRRPGDSARGPDAGQLLTFFDTYDDVFVRVRGKWKISKRHFTNIVSLLIY